MLKQIAVYALAIFLATGVLADQDRGTMTVTGQGEANATPDMAIIDLGVFAFAKEASAAMAANSNQMQQVLDRLDRAGVQGRDVQTASLSLNPRWDRRNSSNEGPKVIGYEANNTVTIRIRDLAQLGGLIDELSKAGANRIQGIRFGLQDPKPLIDQARQAAVKDARSKAALYAEAAEVTLGKILSISETSAQPRPQPMARMAMAEAADAVPIAAGELGLSAQITLVYALE